MNDVKGIIRVHFDFVILRNSEVLFVLNNIITKDVFCLSILDGPEPPSPGWLSVVEIYI